MFKMHSERFYHKILVQERQWVKRKQMYEYLDVNKFLYALQKNIQKKRQAMYL
jgi:hypothetical protein